MEYVLNNQWVSRLCESFYAGTWDFWSFCRVRLNRHRKRSIYKTTERKLSYCPTLTQSMANSMLLINQLWGPHGKIFGPQFWRTDRMKWGPYRNLRSDYFSHGTNNWLIRTLLYSHHEVVRKFSEIWLNITPGPILWESNKKHQD